MTRTNEPPRWAEAVLLRCLRPRDCETIPGDLVEEYRDALLAGTSRLGADGWYLRQVVSILHTEFRRRTTAPRVLQATCALSIVAMIWFGIVSPAPAVPPIAVVFIAQSLTIIALIARHRRLPGVILGLGAIAAVLGGSLALYETLAWTAFELCVAVAGIALISQGMLTLALQFGLFGGFPTRRRAP